MNKKYFHQQNENFRFAVKVFDRNTTTSGGTKRYIDRRKGEKQQYEDKKHF